MNRSIVAMVVGLLFFIGNGFALEGKINIKTIKDKKIIKCLAEYIKNNKTHITMIINEKGEKELHIPKEYVEECKKKLH